MSVPNISTCKKDEMLKKQAVKLDKRKYQYVDWCNLKERKAYTLS